nr:hypothetical protein [Candidatus Sigynarchaeota archaeon]
MLCTNWIKIPDTSSLGKAFGIWGDGTNIYTTGYVWGNATDLVLIKWDMIGNMIWRRVWGGSQNDQGHAVWGTGQEIYTTGFCNGLQPVLLKWEAQGNLLWNRTCRGDTSECKRLYIAGQAPLTPRVRIPLKA